MANALAARRGDGPAIDPDTLQALADAARDVLADADGTVQEAGRELTEGRVQSAIERLTKYAQKRGEDRRFWLTLAKLTYVADPDLSLRAFTRANALKAIAGWDLWLFAKLQAWDARPADAEVSLKSIVTANPGGRLQDKAQGDLDAVACTTMLAAESEAALRSVFAGPRSDDEA
jgi:hypothetical protein